MTPEERSEDARSRAARHPRTEIHRKRISEALKARYAAGVPLPERECWCGAKFIPNSNRQWYCNYECKLAVRRMVRYGLKPSDYAAMFEEQDGVCALCHGDRGGFAPAANRLPLVVDHCHETGKVRALLCPDCNTALGRFGDSTERLREAIAYLEAHASN